MIVELEADHLDGALVLEAISYSRATPVEAPTQPAVAGPFSYGVIPGRPSSFDVHPEAGHVTFTANGTASVAVWGPDDARIATLMLEDETRSLALGSGRHVVMAIQGEAALGAPRAPADLELHPLEIRLERFAPTGNAEGTYRFVEHTSQAEGPVFAMIPSRDGASISINCAPALMRVLQGGEVVGAWHAGGPLLAGGAERVLGDGPIQVTLEGAAQGACLIGSIELAYFVHP